MTATLLRTGRRRWRALRVVALVAALGLVPLAVGSVLMGRDSQQAARVQLDNALANQANERALELEHYFARAASISLITANNPAFGDFYRLPGSRLERVKRHGPVVERIEGALAYLERLYPDSIGEACFIDRSGFENARVVRGERATVADLSNEEENPFFKPAFALEHGQVLHTEPYISPDTKEWVIANVSLMPTRDRSKPAVVHFEVTIESFRRAAGAASPYPVMVVDAGTGAVVVDSRVRQRVGAPLGRQKGGKLAVLKAQSGSGFAEIDGMRVAYRSLDPTAGNQNRWIIAVASPPVADAGLGIGTGALLALLGIVLAGAIFLGVGWLRLTEHVDEGREALRASEQRYTTIVESSEDAIMSSSLDGTITSWNAGAERLYGYSAEEIVGRSTRLLYPPEAPAAESESIGRTLAAGERVGYFETQRMRKDGTRVPVSLSLFPIKDAEGNTLGSAAIARDITEQRAVAAERERVLEREREQVEHLRTLDRLKDEFVALVSHELRTPLTSIRGYIELLLEGMAGEPTAEQARLLGVVDRNAHRLENLVGDLLFVAQVEAGRLQLATGPVELEQIAAEAVESGRPLADQKQIALTLEAEPVPILQGDRGRLGQLLDNFLSNAVKFTPEGGRVQVRVGTEDGQALIEVADTGMGIPASEQKRLFERFFRSSSAAAEAIQGTGLGLAISRAIAEAHGGGITFTSVENEGTVFRITLPLPADAELARVA
jgi:PAS domain S-box-containing protein